jgi:hypothetical protein
MCFLERSCRRGVPAVKELLLKGQVRCETGHQDAWLGKATAWGVQTNWVSTYGKALPRHTISCLGLVSHQPCCGTASGSTDHRGGESASHHPKDQACHLDYHACRGDSAESGLGCFDNQPLNCCVECFVMNVRDLTQDDKMNRPSMLGPGVGAVIVVGTRENRVQGEGRQG